MSLNSEQVHNLARLSALHLSPEEIEKMHTELSDILQYVEQLNKIITTGVPPTFHVHGVVNAFREDIAQGSLSLDLIKSNAPDFSQDGFRVPKIV